MVTWTQQGENRRHKRKAVPDDNLTKVFLYYRQKRQTHGYIRDIGNGGVYLQRIKNLTIPTGSVIQMVFAMDRNNVIKTIRKTGIIVRATGNTDAAVAFIKPKI